MLEYWKREQSIRALLWGMSGFQHDEPDRPEYEGLETTSAVDGSKTLFFPPRKERLRFNITMSVVVVYVLTVLAAFAGIYYYEDRLQSTSSLVASGAASLLNGTTITVGNVLFYYVVVALAGMFDHAFMSLILFFLCH